MYYCCIAEINDHTSSKGLGNLSDTQEMVVRFYLCGLVTILRKRINL